MFEVVCLSDNTNGKEAEMPYVPSEKTNPPAEDRNVLDSAVEALAKDLVERTENNLSLIKEYRSSFWRIAEALSICVKGSALNPKTSGDPAVRLALRIRQVGEKYEYEGAYLGELNYAITRTIQRVPQLKVECGEWEEELRYWLYAATVESLICASYDTREMGLGISGVFEDIKDEYKRRVNTAYEAIQILKSGDCYDTPYYTRLIEVIDGDRNHVGYQEVMLKRSEQTLGKDVLDYRIMVK